MKKMLFLINISLFWLALSVLSDGINTLLLPDRLNHMTGPTQQATTLGLLSFFGLLAGMLVQPLAGAWSDRLRPHWGRKSMLALGTVLVILALVIFGFSSGLVGLALGYLMVQVSASIVQAAQQGFIPDQVPSKTRGLASGIKNFMDIGGAMVGFVLLGQLLGTGQARLAALIIAGLMLVALALTALLVREPRLPTPDAKRSSARWNVFRIDARRHPQFVWLIISRFFFLLGTYAVGRFLLFFVASRLNLDPENAAEQAGNLLAGLALVTILSAPLGGWAADRLGRVPMMLFGALVSTIGVLAYIFASSIEQLFLFGCLLSLGSAAFASANWAMTADSAPREEAGRFFGLANFGTAGAAAAAGLFGPMVDRFNQNTPGNGYIMLFIAAAVAFAISALSLLWLKQPAGDREGIPQNYPREWFGIPVTNKTAHNHKDE